MSKRYFHYATCHVNGLIYSEYISSLTCAVRSNSGDAGSAGSESLELLICPLKRFNLQRISAYLINSFSRLSRVMLIRRGQRGGYRLLPI